MSSTSAVILRGVTGQVTDDVLLSRF